MCLMAAMIFFKWVQWNRYQWLHIWEGSQLDAQRMIL